MEKNNDNENIDYCAPPSEVRSDGTVITSEGHVIDLLYCEHMSPDGDLCKPVMVYRNDIRCEKDCPQCSATIADDKQIFLMDNGEYCYPCTDCNSWVWWEEDELWMYWLE